MEGATAILQQQSFSFFPTAVNGQFSTDLKSRGSHTRGWDPARLASRISYKLMSGHDGMMFCPALGDIVNDCSFSNCSCYRHLGR